MDAKEEGRKETSHFQKDVGIGRKPVQGRRLRNLRLWSDLMSVTWAENEVPSALSFHGAGTGQAAKAHGARLKPCILK